MPSKQVFHIFVQVAASAAFIAAFIPVLRSCSQNSHFQGTKRNSNHGGLQQHFVLGNYNLQRFCIDSGFPGDLPCNISICRSLLSRLAINSFVVVASWPRLSTHGSPPGLFVVRCGYDGRGVGAGQHNSSPKTPEPDLARWAVLRATDGGTKTLSALDRLPHCLPRELYPHHHRL